MNAKIKIFEDEDISSLEEKVKKWLSKTNKENVSKTIIIFIYDEPPKTNIRIKDMNDSL